MEVTGNKKIKKIVLQMLDYRVMDLLAVDSNLGFFCIFKKKMLTHLWLVTLPMVANMSVKWLNLLSECSNHYVG